MRRTYPIVARTEFDYDMLLVLLGLVETRKKSGWRDALFEEGSGRVSRARLVAATESLLQCAAFAEQPPELRSGFADCVRDIRARSTLA